MKRLLISPVVSGVGGPPPGVVGSAGESSDNSAKSVTGSSKAVVSGHTDNTGSPAYNLTLSEKRAAAVTKYLQEKGVETKRMTTGGYGPDHPLADNSSKEEREKNRRVEIRFIQ